MAKVTDVLPELTGEEMVYVQNLIKEWDDEKARSFANVYRTRRKDPQVILITALLGLISCCRCTSLFAWPDWHGVALPGYGWVVFDRNHH
jgi:hypothetical protein